MRRRAGQAVNTLAKSSLSQIANQIHMPSSSLMVFNSLSWARSGLVEMDLGNDAIITEYPGKTAVAFEILSEGAGYRHVRFLAKDVPAMGFKCFALETRHESGVGAPAQKIAAIAASDVAENEYYRVQVDAATGAVKSIFDKQLNRDLVDADSPYRFNEYLYVEGGGKPATQIVYMRKS